MEIIGILVTSAFLLTSYIIYDEITINGMSQRHGMPRRLFITMMIILEVSLLVVVIYMWLDILN